MRRALPVVIMAVMAVAIVVFAIPAVRHWRERPPAPPAPVRASWPAPPDLALGAGPDFPFGLAIAPDGRRIVFPAARNAEPELWLQDLASGAVRALPGTAGAALPFWSPSGTHIGFFSGGRLRALDLEAGTVADLAAAPSGRGASWNAAGDIVFAAAADGGLSLRLADGSLRAITTLDAADGDVSHRWPAFAGDGRHVVFLARTREPQRDGLRLIAIDQAGPPARLAATDAGAIVSGDLLVFASGEALVAQCLDLQAQQATGRAMLLGVPVGRSPQQQLLAAAGGETLVFAPPISTLREIVRVAPDGTREGTVGGPAESYDLRISPDGRRVAITQTDAQLGTLDVFIYDGTRPVPSKRVSPSTSVDEGAVWSPDGSQLAWLSGRRAVTIRGAGAVLPEEVIARIDSPGRVTDWSADRHWLIVTRRGEGTGDDVWAMRSNGGDTFVPVIRSAFNDVQGTVSPDGRWIAWASDDSGRFEVYADRFPKPQGRIRLTSGGGGSPRWRGDGREIYFRRGAEVHVAALAGGGASLEVSSTRRLFAAGIDLRDYDASPDGRWFLLNVPADPGLVRPSTLIVNWRPGEGG